MNCVQGLGDIRRYFWLRPQLLLRFHIDFRNQIISFIPKTKESDKSYYLNVSPHVDVAWLCLRRKSAMSIVGAHWCIKFLSIGKHSDRQRMNCSKSVSQWGFVPYILISDSLARMEANKTVSFISTRLYCDIALTTNSNV